MHSSSSQQTSGAEATSLLGIVAAKVPPSVAEDPSLGSGDAEGTLRLIGQLPLASIRDSSSIFSMDRGASGGGSIASATQHLLPCPTHPQQAPAFEGPPHGELQVLIKLLAMERSVLRSNTQGTLCLEKLRSLKLFECLVEVAQQGIGWYFQFVHVESSVSVMDGSQYVVPPSASRTQEPNTTHRGNASSAMGARRGQTNIHSSDLALIKLTMVCDALFLCVAPPPMRRGANDEAKDDTPQRYSGIHTPSKQTAAAAQDTLMCDESTAKRLSDTLASLVLLSSDCHTDEYAMRRCGLSLTGCLMCLTGCNGSESGQTTPPTHGTFCVHLPRMLLEQQVHRHCPSHLVLLGAAPQLLGAARAAQAERRCSSSVDDPLSSSIAAADSSAAAEHESTQDAPQRLLSILTESIAMRCVLADSIYVRSFGDPFHICERLFSTVVAPALHAFTQCVSVEFWAYCDASALLSYCWALCELKQPAHAPTSEGLVEDREALQQFFEDVGAFGTGGDASLNSPNSETDRGGRRSKPGDGWRCVAAWLAWESSRLKSSSHADAAFQSAGRIVALICSDTERSADGDTMMSKMRRMTLEVLQAPPAGDASWTTSGRVNPLLLSPADGDDGSTWGSMSTAAEVGVSVVLFVDAVLEWMDTLPSAEAQTSWDEQLQAASNGAMRISSLFHDVTLQTLDAYARGSGGAPTPGRPSGDALVASVAMRCLGHHLMAAPSSRLTCTVLLRKYLLCDGAMRRVGGSKRLAEGAVEGVLLTNVVLYASPPAFFAEHCGTLLHGLSQASLYRLPLSSRVLLSSCWLRLVLHTMSTAPSDVVRHVLCHAHDPLLPIRLLNECANALLLAMFMDQEGVAVLGVDATAQVLLNALRVLTIVSTSGHADAVIRHEVSWDRRNLSLLHVLLLLLFQSNHRPIVEAACTLITDGLESFVVCNRQRAQGGAGPLADNGSDGIGFAERDGTQPLAAMRGSATTKDRTALSLLVLETLAASHDPLLSVARLIVLKAMLVYDTWLFQFLFTPDASSSTSQKQGGDGSRSNADAKTKASGADRVLTELLLDTVRMASSPPRERAESLDLLRRQRRTSGLTVVHVIEFTRQGDAFAVAAKSNVDCNRNTRQHNETRSSNDSIAGSAQSQGAAVAFSAACADYGVFAAAVSKYVAQEVATAIQTATTEKNAQQPQASSGGRNGNNSNGTPLSPLRGASSSDGGSGSASRCAFVVTHSQLLDELLSRNNRFIAALTVAAQATSKDVCDALDGLDAALHPGQDFHTKRVRLHYGDAFAFVALAPCASAVCTHANRCASALDALTELVEAQEALVLATYRDRDAGSILEKLLDTLSVALAALPLCSPVHAELAWYAGRLLRSLVCTMRTVSACVRHVALQSQSMAPPKAASAVLHQLGEAMRCLAQSSELLGNDEAVVGILSAVTSLHDIVNGDLGVASAAMELAVRSVQLRCFQEEGRTNAASRERDPTVPTPGAFCLPLDVVHAVLATVTQYGASASATQTLALVNAVWACVQGELHTLAIAQPCDASAVHIRVLLGLLEAVVLQCAEGTAYHLPLDDVLKSVSLLGTLAATAFHTEATPAMEMSWFVVWKGCLGLLRAMVLRLPTDAADWLDAIADALTTCPRFVNSLRGPRRPLAPHGVPSATIAAAFEATVLVSELHETELVAQLLALLVHASPRSHATYNGVQRCVDAMCYGFALLRKPAMLLSVVRRPSTSVAEARDLDTMCATIVKDLLMALALWSTEDPRWLKSDLIPTSPMELFQSSNEGRGGRPSTAPPEWRPTAPPTSTHQPAAHTNAGNAAPRSPYTDWVVRTTFSLDALREYIVSQFTTIKKIQRDTPGVSAGSGSTATGPMPPTPHLTSASLSPSLRSNDCSDSVAESEPTNANHYFEHHNPQALNAHVQGTRAALNLFLQTVQVRIANSGDRWTGGHNNQRDVAEKLEVSLKSVLADVRNYGLDEFASFLDRAREGLDAALHGKR